MRAAFAGAPFAALCRLAAARSADPTFVDRAPAGTPSPASSRKTMPQLFSRSADSILRTGMASVVMLGAFVVAALMAVVRSPYLTSQNRTIQQPVPFSHQHHVGDAGIDCRYCHTSVEVSSVAGIPATEICMNCHRYLWTDAAVLEPVRTSWRTGTPLVWSRVYDLPDHVYFNHSIHIHKGVGCYSCHGRVGTMPLTRQTAPLTMQWCLDCHRDPVPHLRPRELVFEPVPLEELTDSAGYRDAVRQVLQSRFAPAESPPADSAPQTEMSTAQLRSALAEQYGVNRRTDCYTCHR